MGKTNLKTADLCSQMGVTPQELYMRQQGLCFLVGGTTVSGVLEDIYCTDGVDKVPTRYLANPTIECSRCLTYCILKRADETAYLIRGIKASSEEVADVSQK